MKKITYFILEIEPNDNAIKIFKKHPNSLISQLDNKFYFKSHFKTQKEEIDFSCQKIKMDEELFERLKKLLNESLIEVKNISKESIKPEKIKGSLHGSIYSVVYKYSNYKKEDKKDVFDFTTNIFVSMLTGHYLWNGNKRVALVFLWSILWELGYYLKWTKGFFVNYSVHKSILEHFVITLEKNKIIGKQEIKKWLIQNVIIGLNWRKNI